MPDQGDELGKGSVVEKLVVSNKLVRKEETLIDSQYNYNRNEYRNELTREQWERC